MSNASANNASANTASAKRKRTQDPEPDDDDEEDDFEEDTRGIGTERRQKRSRIDNERSVRAIGPRVDVSRRRRNEVAESEERDNGPASSTAPPPAQPRPLPAVPRRLDRSSESAPPASSGQKYAAANREAVQAKAERRPLLTQVRKKWTVDENDRLITLIEEYGCSWAYLKQVDEAHPDGPRLEDRDQVALKDKARNMRHDFHKYVVYSVYSAAQQSNVLTMLTGVVFLYQEISTRLRCPRRWSRSFIIWTLFLETTHWFCGMGLKIEKGYEAERAVIALH